jgi:hypothetical protein
VFAEAVVVELCLPEQLLVFYFADISLSSHTFGKLLNVHSLLGF